MLLIVEIIFCNIRIFGCHADQLIILQKFTGAFRSADAHTAFSETEIHDFIHFASFFKDDVFAGNADISGTVLNIGRYVRTFCKEKT